MSFYTEDQNEESSLAKAFEKSLLLKHVSSLKFFKRNKTCDGSKSSLKDLDDDIEGSNILCQYSLNSQTASNLEKNASKRLKSLTSSKSASSSIYSCSDCVSTDSESCTEDIWCNDLESGWGFVDIDDNDVEETERQVKRKSKLNIRLLDSHLNMNTNTIYSSYGTASSSHDGSSISTIESVYDLDTL
jgi:hypothetical protein